MIIPEEELRIVSNTFVDANYHEATLVVHCGSDGLFIGKVFLDRKRILATPPEATFKKALSKIIEMVAEDYGDEE